MTATILVAGAILATAVVPAVADELSDLLDAAAEADYSGRQIVVTFVEGATTLEILTVEHAGSLTMVDAAGTEAVFGAGKLSADGGGFAVSSWNPAQMSDRYTVDDGRSVRRLSRDATAVQVLEDGQVRMRLVFDDATGTPLVTEVYDGSGEIFRLTSMLEVDPIPAKLYSAQGHYADEFEILAPTSRHSLPSGAAGYTLADAYRGPEDSVQGFYSDGLFSFSLFVVAGSAESDRLASATTVEFDGLKYRRLVDPAEMWITWMSGGNTYVLVGDLPPDHLESVLNELPKPGRRNLISRLWSGLFG